VRPSVRADGQQDATGPRRTLTLARYAILVEGGHSTQIRRQLAETGSRVNAWFANWLRLIGSRDTGHDVHVLGSYITGRTAALPELSGPGTADLRKLLEPSPAA
jgi:hypothetical protein